MTDPVATPMDSEVPATVTGMLALSELKRGDFIASRFRIERLLGMGGMGLVYLAHDEQLDVDVALKVLRPELASRPQAFERFRHELLLARQVSSPHVVRIHDLVQHGELWLLSMDFVAGQSLEKLIDSEPAMDPQRALSIIRQVALGLSAAHSKGVIHRDLKPANVLLTDTDEALITDFGVARSVGASGLTMTGAIVGTPEYLSPEQARAEPVDGRSDLYALGLMLHELLTGRIPFAGGTPAEMLAQRIVRSPPSISDQRAGLPAFVVALCGRLLELRPRHRFQSALDVVAAIDEASVPRSIADKRRLMAVVGLALVGILAIGISSQLDWSSDAETLAALPALNRAPELVVLPSPSREAAADQLLLEGLERQLTQRLLQAGVDVVDTQRLQRTMLESGISRQQAERMAGPLRKALGARRTLSFELTDSDAGPVLELELLDLDSDTSVWTRAIPLGNGETLSSDLATMWAELSPLLQSGALPTPFSDADELRLLAAANQADTEAGVLTDADSASTDRWWWALARLEREGKLADAQRLAADALKSIDGDESAGAGRVRAMARYLSGDPEQAWNDLEELSASTADQPLRLLRARVLIALGRYEDAAGLLGEVVERDQRNVDALFLLGKSELLMGESQQAMDNALTRALVAANRLGDRQLQADVTNAMGIGYRQLGQLELAAAQFERAIDLRRELGDRRGEGGALRNLAAVQSIQGQFDLADGSLDAAREVIEPLGDPSAMADLESDRGLAAEERGDFRAALKSYREALDFRQAQGDPRWIAESLLNVGFAYYYVGEFDNAQVFLQQAVQAYRSIDDRAGAIRADQGLGLSQMARGEFRQAREVIESSLLAAEALQMREEQSTALAALAELDRLEGGYRAASERSRSAATQFAERGDLRGELEMLLLLAAIQLDTGDLVEAGKTLDRAEQMPAGNAEQQAILLLRRARLALDAGELDSASALSAQARETAAGTGAAVIETQATLVEVLVQSAQGATAAAQATLIQAESGLARFASIPLRLLVLETRLAIAPGDLNAYQEARTLIAGLPSYGVEWRVALRALRAPLSDADRAEASRRLAGSLQRVKQTLTQSQWLNFVAALRQSFPEANIDAE